MQPNLRPQQRRNHGIKSPVMTKYLISLDQSGQMGAQSFEHFAKEPALSGAEGVGCDTVSTTRSCSKKGLPSRPEQLVREAKQLRSGGTCFWVEQRFSAAMKYPGKNGFSR